MLVGWIVKLMRKKISKDCELRKFDTKMLKFDVGDNHLFFVDFFEKIINH